ncbi:hypothetical protein M422DRAFT_44533 [Sphaerobolus stellatus SS14]|nr:hypothetical protein M422DRAFT_44533 [Sphaerobolus stellatus SS14]
MLNSKTEGPPSPINTTQKEAAPSPAPPYQTTLHKTLPLFQAIDNGNIDAENVNMEAGNASGDSSLVDPNLVAEVSSSTKETSDHDVLGCGPVESAASNEMNMNMGYSIEQGTACDPMHWQMEQLDPDVATMLEAVTLLSDSGNWTGSVDEYELLCLLQILLDTDHSQLYTVCLKKSWNFGWCFVACRDNRNCSEAPTECRTTAQFVLLLSLHCSCHINMYSGLFCLSCESAFNAAFHEPFATIIQGHLTVIEPKWLVITPLHGMNVLSVHVDKVICISETGLSVLATTPSVLGHIGDSGSVKRPLPEA